MVMSTTDPQPEESVETNAPKLKGTPLGEGTSDRL